MEYDTQILTMLEHKMRQLAKIPIGITLILAVTVQPVGMLAFGGPGPGGGSTSSGSGGSGGGTGSGGSSGSGGGPGPSGGGSSGGGPGPSSVDSTQVRSGSSGDGGGSSGGPGGSSGGSSGGPGGTSGSSGGGNIGGSAVSLSLDAIVRGTDLSRPGAATDPRRQRLFIDFNDRF